MQIAVRMVTLMITAMVTENIVFGRAIGISDPEKQRPMAILKTGAVLAIIIALSCTVAAMISPLVTAENRVWVEPILYTTLVSLMYFIAYVTIRMTGIKRGINTENICKMLATATFNSATLGMVLIVTRRLYSPLDAIAYGIGGAVGYVAAMLLLRRQRHHAKLLRVPKAFKGLPITLVYIGIISLALYGLIGHQLTT